MEFEQNEWGDGTIRLYFEDTLHGQDLVFVLHADGTVREVVIRGEEETTVPVDLATALRDAYTAWRARE